MNIKTEYLVVLSENGSFCSTAESLNKLLSADSSITVLPGKIRYLDKIECGYRIVDGEIEATKHKYFHIELVFIDESGISEEKLHDYSELLKKLRENIIRIKGRIEILWDDVSKHYATLAYPKIFEIESLMRKLIQNFMIITVGKDWISDALPKELIDKFDKSKRRDDGNPLHSLDFIDLMPLLTRPYSSETPDAIYKLIQSADSVEMLMEIKNLMPQSNWKRYFGKLISNCEDSHLSKMWKDLYDLRCKVAHNSFVSKFDYDSVVSLTDRLNVILSNAIKNLPQVKIPTDERETVAESAATNINTLYGQYIHLWKQLESILYRLSGANLRHSVSTILEKLSSKGEISEADYLLMKNFAMIRNHIVHNRDFSVNENTLEAYIGMLNEQLDKISAIEDRKGLFA